MNNPHVFIINLRDYKEQTINYKKILVNNIINGQNVICTALQWAPSLLEFRCSNVD